MRTFNYDVVALAPVQQAAQPCEHGVLGACTAFCREGVVLVAGEAAGEVLAHVAVGNFLGAVHQHFSAVVELRYAVDGKQYGQSLLKCGRVLALAEEAVCVVVLDEGHHARRIGIKVVVDEVVVNAVQAGSEAVGVLALGLVYLVVEAEVHDGLQVAVLLGQL